MPVTAEARAVVPPQGTMFITPALSTTRHSSISRFMPRRRYSGSRAGITSRKVAAPMPSRWVTAVTATVTTATASGLPPVLRSRKLTSGANRPRSRMTPK